MGREGSGDSGDEVDAIIPRPLSATIIFISLAFFLKCHPGGFEITNTLFTLRKFCREVVLFFENNLFNRLLEPADFTRGVARQHDVIMTTS